MESYLKACDVKCLKAATEGFNPPAKDTALTPLEQENKKWNTKAKNHIFRGLCKEVFNRVRNHKSTHELWTELCALHEGSMSEREQHFHLVMHKLNISEMLPKENANEMYSRLNVIIEELNGLGLNQMSPADVARKILCVLSIEKYGHIVAVLHQGDLSTATPTSILGKINAHEMYMHINPQDSSSLSKKEKKDLALKASHKGMSKKIEVKSSTSSDDDATITLMVRRTTRMLKKLNKNGVNFDSKKKKKFFISSKRKPISEMDCYNCGELGHLAHQCPKPKKDKYKKKNKEQDDSRRKVERRRSTTRRMARHILLVIGSPTLKAQVETLCCAVLAVPREESPSRRVTRERERDRHVFPLTPPARRGDTNTESEQRANHHMDPTSSLGSARRAERPERQRVWTKLAVGLGGSSPPYRC